MAAEHRNSSKCASWLAVCETRLDHHLVRTRGPDHMLPLRLNCCSLGDNEGSMRQAVSSWCLVSGLDILLRRKVTASERSCGESHRTMFARKRTFASLINNCRRAGKRGLLGSWAAARARMTDTSTVWMGSSCSLTTPPWRSQCTVKTRTRLARSLKATRSVSVGRRRKLYSGCTL